MMFRPSSLGGGKSQGPELTYVHGRILASLDIERQRDPRGRNDATLVPAGEGKMEDTLRAEI